MKATVRASEAQRAEVLAVKSEDPSLILASMWWRQKNLCAVAPAQRNTCTHIRPHPLPYTLHLNKIKAFKMRKDTYENLELGMVVCTSNPRIQKWRFRS